MRLRDNLLAMGLIWLCLYPSAVAITYAMIWLQIEWPPWAQILLSTVLTVPLVTFVVVPRVDKAVAAIREQTVAELRVDQAREAEGPSPETIVARR